MAVTANLQARRIIVSLRKDYLKKVNLSNANSLRSWIHSVERLGSRHASVNLVPENRVYVDNVPDGFLFLVALLHQSHSFTRDQAQSDDVRLHRAIQFNCVFGVQQEAFGDDSGVVDQKIEAAVDLLDPLEGGGDLKFIANVDFYAVEVDFFILEGSSNCLVVEIKNDLDEN